MATNYVGPGNNWYVASPSTTAGDPVVIEDTPGVALTDTDEDGKVALATEGEFKLSVTGNDGSADAAMNAGQKVYHNGSGLDADSSGKLFGKLREGVASGATSIVPVKIIQA
jgi:predicted RecA/RadA family phage recombinase